MPFGEGKQIRKPACKRDYPSCTPLSGKRAKKPRRDLKHVADPVGSEERMSSSIFTGSFISAIAASSIAKEELSILPEAIQIRTEQWVDTLQPVLLNSGTSNTNGSEPKENSIQSVSRTSRRDGVCMKFGSGGLVSGVPTTCVSIPGALEPSEHNIKKRETAVEVESRCSLVRMLLQLGLGDPCESYTGSLFPSRKVLLWMVNLIREALKVCKTVYPYTRCCLIFLLRLMGSFLQW